jgi:hypothetical protein
MSGKKHLVIPDCQVRPGVPTKHISWISQFAIDKKPDSIIIIGDWADMSSLSSYDVGKKAFEGRSYAKDIEVANDCLSMLVTPWDVETARLKRRRQTQWNPRKVVTLGNHEERINIAVNNDRKLDGLISIADIRFKEFGFETHPFLKPAVIDGVAYAHYFVSGVMGRPVTTARALITKHHMSCFAGHQQGRDIAYGKRADGKKITAIISGSCYLHDEEYLNAQTNDHWRGCYMLHEVEDGSFDEMPVSLRFLEERYGQKS